ncbi:MAG: molybdopterin-dependent oxidoreductase [Rhodospirillaceae bacterium]|nr:molybdopterin-dependent oxidoreductase [Rhodospirillaceae bacterium]
MGTYLRPNALDAALQALSARDWTILAGGTDFYPARVGRRIDEDILDITAIAELQGIAEADDHIRIGATTTWSDVIAADLPPSFRGLQLAAREVGGMQVQNAGTVCGNVCNASPAADGVPPLLTLDAVVEIASAYDERRVALAEFITGNRQTALSPGELVTGLCIPKPTRPSRSTFIKLGARRYLVISIVMVSVILEDTGDGKVAAARIVVGSCSEVAQRLVDLERMLIGRPLHADLANVPQPDHFRALTPINDVRGTAAYRHDAALTCVRRALAELGERGPAAAARSAGFTIGKRLPPPAGAPIAFVVNGETVRVSAPPVSRLADVLREELGLTGTKVGCDAGDCGACTILMDGRQICACMVPVAQAAGRRITTVEGLAANGTLSRLQSAFDSQGAAQCGICTPGMLMAASDLLSHKDGELVTEQEICDALGGVLCRCTGYRNIVAAVLTAANDSVLSEDAEPAAGAAVGARLKRLDAPEKLRGEAVYGADHVPENTLWLRIIRSPYAHASFTLGDFDDLVDRTPGLERILTWADIPGNNGFGIYPDIKDQMVLAKDVVRYPGDAVAALVGERDAVESIHDEDLPIDWQPLVPVTGIASSLAEEAPQLHAGCPGNVLTHGRLKKGDVDAGLDRAHVQVGGNWETTYVEHAYIEPEAGYALRVGDRIEIHASTQSPYMDRDEVAQVMGFEPDRIRISPTACGGGFGGKLDVSVQPVLAVAAWHLERPVRCVYTRPESMAASTKRHPSRISARAATDREGKLTAYRFEGDFDTGAYASWGPTVADRVPVHASGPYAVPAVEAHSRAIHTNGPPSGAFRGFGVPQASLAHEDLMDALADKLGMDRLEFRLLNAIRAGDETPTSQRLIHSVGLVQCLEALQSRWRGWKALAAEFNVDGNAHRRGVGIGCMWYGIGNTSMSNPSTMEVGIDRRGRITLYNGAQEIGQGTTTIMIQICADALGVPVDAFDHVMGDTDLTLDAGKSSASRQALVSGNAARLAGEDLRAQVLRLSNASPDAHIQLKGAELIVTDGDATRRVDLSRLPEIDGSDVLRGRGTFDPPTTPLDGNGQGEPYATYGFAAQIVEVDVDMELGLVRPLRFVAAHDVGRAINPTQVEGQIHGGIAQGIGFALMEEYIPGRTENLHDYLIPTVGDVPDIECIIIEDEEPLGPYGAKGIGEPALIPTAPAILSAIDDAAGVRIRSLPATPDRVRAALLERKGG